jgi:thymidylate synthase ThyX
MTVEITIPKFNNPEDEAMAQALYSRSDTSVKEHMKKIEEVGSGNFMKTYYVGYGHRSIGDCGHITIFIEGLSMLAAKAFEDHQLFSGQETSTRYLNFKNRNCFIPDYGNKVCNILASETKELSLELYGLVQESIYNHLLKSIEKPEDIPEKQYLNTLKARSFDVARGMLPAGMTTQMSWHTSFSNLNENLPKLLTHPLQEVRVIAKDIHVKMKEEYPSSIEDFSDEVLYYHKKISVFEYYNTRHYLEKAVIKDFVRVNVNKVSKNYLKDFSELFNERPKYTSLPKKLNDAGNINTVFQIDFGGYRDLARHRTGTNRVSILSIQSGINDWYLSQINQLVNRNEILSKLNKIVNNLDFISKNYEVSKIDLQYITPMATNVLMEMNLPFVGFIYMLELRSGRSVHPTVRRVILNMVDLMVRDMKGVITPEMLYLDSFPLDEIPFSRGKQTIEKK